MIASSDIDMNALSDTEQASIVTRLQDVVDRLRALGAQAGVQSDLCTLVVAGEQGSGKSSLVEAISGITVPRDPGVCTRCPIECRLRKCSDRWSARISIRWEYDKNESRLSNIQEVPFGPVLSRPQDVESYLRRAQAAVLNPETETSDWLTKSEAELRSISLQFNSFSKNSICIDVSAPVLASLNFVDLPGLFKNPSSDLNDYVEELVLAHMKGDRLMLLTLSMSDDIENQKVVQLARIVDPEGLRTIGVVTKPDTLLTGAHQIRLWQDVLEGRRYPLKHGYYCIRQPDEEQRVAGVSRKEARSEEQAFFSTTTPWSNTSHPERFGTNNLVSALSILLTDMIHTTLPSILADTTQSILDCSHHLALLAPSIPSDPSTFILNLVTQLVFDCQKLVHGFSDQSLVHQIRDTYTTYRDLIRASAPCFFPVPTAQDNDNSVLSQDVILEEWEAGIQGPPIYLQDVRQLVKGSLSRELPRNVPYPAKVALIQNFQVGWQSMTDMCFRSVCTSFEQLLTSLINAHCGQFDQLRSVIISHVQDLLRVAAEATSQQLAFFLSMELSPYTQHDQELEALKTKYLAKYKDIRLRQVHYSHLSSVGNSADSLGGAGVASPLGHAASQFRNPAHQRASDLVHVSNSQATFIESMPAAIASPSSSFTADPPPPSVAKQAQSGMKRKGRKPNSDPAPPPPRAESTATAVNTTHSQVQGGFLSIQGPGFPRVDYTAPVNLAGFNATEGTGLLNSSRDQLENAIVALFGRLGMEHVTRADFAKLNLPDQYEEELNLMADVRAYFHISYKRITDYVPMTIDHMFLYSFAESLQASMIPELGLGAESSEARWAEYLAESPSATAERAELEERLGQLESIQEELHHLYEILSE